MPSCWITYQKKQNLKFTLKLPELIDDENPSFFK